MIYLKLVFLVSLSMATVMEWIPILVYVFTLRRGRSSTPAGRNVPESSSASQYSTKHEVAAKQEVVTVPEVEGDWPKFCIMTTLRGADPRIAKNLQSVLDLDYPNFEWHLVIDHKDDPSHEILDQVRQANSAHAQRLKVQVLRDRNPRRSLLCSSFLQIIENLDDSFELVTFWDGDMLVRPDWLKQMARVMADPSVGGTLGNRWYMPATNQWGSLCRFIWNVGAVIPMWAMQIPWSGGLTMRLSDVRRSTLMQSWSTGLVEDAPTKKAITELGKRMHFVPELLVVNREDITLGHCFQFILRQVLWTRLYHPNWPLVMIGTSFFTAAFFSPALVAIGLVCCGYQTAAIWWAVLFLAYWFSQFAAVLTIDSAAQGLLTRHGEESWPWGRGCLIRLFLAIPLTQLAYFAATLKCSFVRSVDWRGIQYTFRGPHDVRMTEYRPYLETTIARKSNDSL